MAAEIGIVGTGLVGFAVASRLLCFPSFSSLIVWNRTKSKAEALQQVLTLHPTFVEVVESAQEVVRRCSVVLSILFDFEANQQVLISQLDKEEVAGKTFIVMTDLSPTQSRLLEEQFLLLGASHFIEAPVYADSSEIVEGKGKVLLACKSKELAERWTPLLSSFGSVHFLGQSPNANVFKFALLFNPLVHLASLATTIAVLDKHGIDFGPLQQLLADSAQFPPYMASFASKMIRRDYSQISNHIHGLMKDIHILETEVKAIGLDCSFVEAFKALATKAMQQGHGNDDFCSLYEVINPPPKY